jgi:hypothetical protein
VSIKRVCERERAKKRKGNQKLSSKKYNSSIRSFRVVLFLYWEKFTERDIIIIIDKTFFVGVSIDNTRFFMQVLKFVTMHS